MSSLLPRHRAHDYAALMAGWERVVARAGLHAVTLGSAEHLPIMLFESAASSQGAPAIYLSAGIHGDEPAPPWALLEWAQANISLLRREPFILSPCLNPIGLIGNTRVNHRGEDINRRFHITRDPLIKAWQRFMKKRKIMFGLCLHEDYDAQGCYVYELGPRRHILCEPAMTAVEAHLPRDSRRQIEGRTATRGIIRPRQIPSGLRGPEAIVLHRFGCPVTLTFETPSEFGLDTRVQAHRRFIDASLEHIAGIRA